MDALGVLEQVFQLLWPGRLGAQPPLCPVSREPLPPPPPARPRPLPAHTRSVCPLIPRSQLECGWGWWGQAMGSGPREGGGVLLRSEHPFLPDFPGRNLAGETAMNTGCASCR